VLLARLGYTFLVWVVLWNTVCLQQVVQALRAEGEEIPNQDLAHLSLARYRHINRLGEYTLSLPEGSGAQRAA
jgi:hypothetical protein